MSTISEVGPWELGLSLGSGGPNSSRLAKHRETGQLAVVKPIVGWSELTSSQQARIEGELVLLRLIEHPNVLQLIDVISAQEQLFVVVEYMPGGELFDCMLRKGSFTEQDTAKFLWQILCGLEYCHKLHICHRDLKPENLYLDAHGSIKIGEFGMASIQQPGKLLQTSCGSPHYASPEIIMGRSYDGCASDIWSCGIIFFALLTGKLPFDDDNIRSLLLKVCQGQFEMPSNISPQAQHLLYRMLDVDSSTRITMEQIREHPFLSCFVHPNISIPIISAPIQPIDPLIVQHLSLVFRCSDDPMPLYEKLASQSPLVEKTLYTLLSRHLHPPSSAAVDRNRAVVDDLLGTAASNGQQMDEEEIEQAINIPTLAPYPISYAAESVPRPATSASPFLTPVTTSGTFNYSFNATNPQSILQRPATTSSAVPQLPKSVTPGLAYPHDSSMLSSNYRPPSALSPRNFNVSINDPEVQLSRRATSLDMSNDFRMNENDPSIVGNLAASNFPTGMGPPRKRVTSRMSEHTGNRVVSFPRGSAFNPRVTRFNVGNEQFSNNIDNNNYNQPYANATMNNSRDRKSVV